MNEIFSSNVIVSFLLGVISSGIVSCFFYRIQTRSTKKQLKLLTQLQMERREFCWGEIQQGVEHIYNNSVEKFDPDIIITFSDTAMIIAGLIQRKIMDCKGKVLPVYCLPLEIKNANTNSSWIPVHEYENYYTKSWKIFVSKWLLERKNARFLIVVDAVSSGQSIINLCKLLEKKGCQSENINAWTVLRLELGSKNMNNPDWKYVNHVQKVLHGKIDFPWGEAF